VPELPELEIYRERLRELATGPITRAEVHHFFTVRTFTPPFSSLVGQRLVDVSRRGKILILSFERAHLVIHLKLMGRLHWNKKGKGLWRIDFESGSLSMTENTTKKMGSVHLLERVEDYPDFPKGVDALSGPLPPLEGQLKTALTDQSVITGIGNAYSDEILFEARLSPLKLARTLTQEESDRLAAAIPKVLREWIDTIRKTCKALPDDQPKWRKFMKVHGQFKKPCPGCATPIERISYAEKETHYCPKCQNEGRVLADRRFSRFLK
jgi:formamidopyrimidine-DNA glycosylase